MTWIRERGALALLFLSLLPAPAGAWGSDGHRIVGEIAWRHLTPRAKREIAALLPPGPYATLAEACTWADREGRRERGYRWLRPLHYVHLDLAADGVTLDEANCPDGACLLAAIERFRNDLTRRDASREERVLALRLLGHLIGDVHQPLHVVAARDSCGGCRIEFRYGTHRRMTLHALWDSGLLEEGMDRRYRRGGSRGRGRKEFWRRLAADLDTETGRDERLRWEASADPKTWAEESVALARGPLLDIGEGSTLPGDYGARAFPVVEARLAAAGIRLAATLNAVFARW